MKTSQKNIKVKQAKMPGDQRTSIISFLKHGVPADWEIDEWTAGYEHLRRSLVKWLNDPRNKGKVISL